MKLTLTVACIILKSAWQAVCRPSCDQLRRLSSLRSGSLRTALIALLLAPLPGTHAADADPLAWPETTRDAKPWTAWWWMGSAVDKATITRELTEFRNELEIEVTNVAANRIRDLDQRRVEWRIFHDINFVSITGKRFDASAWPLTDSGLLGPVTLRPAKRLNIDQGLSRK